MAELDNDPELSKLARYLIHQSLPLAITTSGYNPTTRDLEMIEQALMARYGPDLASVSVREIDGFLHQRFKKMGESPNKRAIRRLIRIVTSKIKSRS
ncbi:hypothetical protein ACTJJ7_02650 [Phyllobacterium sp. 22229]|uniref:Uncharacterized protein n=1 Tax=Phyllobacterium myrsinacearum TaxID=28101 RepID=A0A2S9JQC6_9HYPH|nr:hypothetical protein [Phyllobacterium myrsinacearum]PRD55381.1 hypothetical protein C5750_09490 [Phyllobacterium myrsinacearum]PWV91714.1 hypothetical protein DEV92_10565 [Phyllobacterium myrsinacearum]RZS77442.1 hypothetical protein EV217_4804 [Phyllobacterium myrsinacearum]RZV05785.1 hypothetical protein EV654_3232 [Phyllobacterium myrsinacearum]